jgi:hypothetical protein
VPGPPCDQLLPWSATLLAWTTRRDDPGSPSVFGSANANRISTAELPATWINGWSEMTLDADPRRSLVAPAGSSTIVELATGAAAIAANAVTYHGLPVIGFSAQSYSTTGLPGVSASVLSNYGGSFVHRLARGVDFAP